MVDFLLSLNRPFQQPNPFLKFNLSYLKKIIFYHSEGGWEGQNKSVPYTSLAELENCITVLVSFIP